MNTDKDSWRIRAEKAEKELAGADAEITELRDELEDSRGTEKDAPNVLCAIARLVGVYEHCQELGDDMGTMSLEAVQDLIADKQQAEARVKSRNNHIHRLLGEALENERNLDGMKSRWQTAEDENARLTKALETQRNLTASAHATAEAAWGGEIPSPFPGHTPPSEDAMVERFNHLNCPLCGGSGHIDDCGHDSAEAIARLTKERDWLAKALAEDGCPYLALWSDFGSEMRPDWCICIDTADDGFDCNGDPNECWKKEAARKSVAAG